MNVDSDNNVQNTESVSQAEGVCQLKPPTCRLSIVSVISFLLVIPLIAIVIALESMGKDTNFLSYLFIPVLAYAIIGSPIIAVISKIRIALSDGRLKGNTSASLVIIGSSLLLILIAGSSMSGASRKIAERVVCGTNLKSLATAITVYANDYDGRIPTASQWCDLLIQEADVLPKHFLCRSSDAVYGESCYALNQYVAGKRLRDLPDGMVLLFETNSGRSGGPREGLLNCRQFVKKIPDVVDRNPNKHKVFKERWNQVGGPEIFANNHRDGTNVAFADGHSEFISFRYPDRMSGSYLEQIDWDESRTRFPASAYLRVGDVIEKQRQPLSKIAISLCIAVCMLGIVVIALTQAWQYPLFTFLIAIGSAIVGFIFGGWGEMFYQTESFARIGTFGGMGLGLWIGLCYVGVLMKLQPRLKRDESIGLLASSLGMVAGMICSTLLHLALILIHRDNQGWAYMIVALPFGIVGGAILGSISGWVVCKFYRPVKSEVVNG